MIENELINISDDELRKLTEIYTQLREPRRELVIMGLNLLLASQNAERVEFSEIEEKELEVTQCQN